MKRLSAIGALLVAVSLLGAACTVGGPAPTEWKVKPEVLPAGQRPFDLARWRHEQSKWSTGQYRSVVEALDAVTPRRGWLRR